MKRWLPEPAPPSRWTIALDGGGARPERKKQKNGREREGREVRGGRQAWSSEARGVDSTCSGKSRGKGGGHCALKMKGVWCFKKRGFTVRCVPNMRSGALSVSALPPLSSALPPTSSTGVMSSTSPSASYERSFSPSKPKSPSLQPSR
jgi:hypothetical protein